MSDLAMLHVAGGVPCHKPALRMTDRPPVGTAVVRRALFRHMDGTPVADHNIPRCDSCGGWFEIRREGIREYGQEAR